MVFDVKEKIYFQNLFVLASLQVQKLYKNLQLITKGLKTIYPEIFLSPSGKSLGALYLNDKGLVASNQAQAWLQAIL